MAPKGASRLDSVLTVARNPTQVYRQARRAVTEGIAAARRAWEGKSSGSRAYDGASTGRRLGGWATSGSSANTEVSLGHARMRDRARDLVRNDPHAARFVTAFATDLVGRGLRLQAATGVDRLDKQYQQLWDDWQGQAPAEYEFGLYQWQHTMARAWVESGEVLARRRPRRMGDMSAGRPLVVPLQIQTLECDQLDPYKCESGTWGRQVLGVEFDPVDRRTGYWLYRTHPGEQLPIGFTANPLESVKVPAEDVIHLFQPLRPGQVRGVTWLAPVIQALHDLGGYQDAERVRHRIASCLAGVVTTEETDPALAGLTGMDPNGAPAGTLTDAAGRPIEGIEPGMIAIAHNGKAITWTNPPQVQGYADYVVSNLHGIAAGLSMPYEVISGDLSRVNYSSIRFGMLSYLRTLESLQETLVVPVMCEPVRRWFNAAAIAAGVLQDRPEGYPAIWHAHPHEDLDREKEARADILELRGGLTAFQRVLGRRGLTLQGNLADMAQAAALLDKFALIVDSDPRKTSTSGTASGQGGDAAQNARTVRMLAALSALEQGDTEAARMLASDLVQEIGREAPALVQQLAHVG